jgi:hypothetical protein
VARPEALARALVSEVRGAEAMLNTSLPSTDGPMPALVSRVRAATSFVVGHQVGVEVAARAHRRTRRGRPR